jgi:hypothetical protein
MLNLPCMGIFKNKSTWNNLLDMYRMTLALFVTLRNIFMVLRNILDLGMPKWKNLFLTSTFLDVILTLMSIEIK